MDLNTLKPPTNNFYIFFAVLGLCIVAVSYVHQDSAETAARQKVIAFANFSSESLYRISEFKVGFDSLSEDEKQRVRNSIELDNSKFNSLGAEMKVLARKSGEARLRAKIGYVLGGLMSVLGFFFWYNKTQKFQDALLKNMTKKQRVSFKKTL
ncbi:hypothetical protein QNE79_003926 [Vibrio alginolyticus]|nr:hypothetical protein [Vibrio alginolyticus]HCZ9536401.1 hypothetical protein [Vibrio alginolyticus]